MIQLLMTIAVLGLTMLLGFGMMAATCMFASRPTSVHPDEKETVMVPHAPTVSFIAK